MYGWLWHRLPGSTPVRAVMMALTVLAAVAALWLYAFPWARSTCRSTPPASARTRRATRSRAAARRGSGRQSPSGVFWARYSPPSPSGASEPAGNAGDWNGDPGTTGVQKPAGPPLPVSVGVGVGVGVGVFAPFCT